MLCRSIEYQGLSGNARKRFEQRATRADTTGLPGRLLDVFWVLQLSSTVGLQSNIGERKQYIGRLFAKLIELFNRGR